MNPITPITTTINNFCRLTDLGRSKTYELLASGAQNREAPIDYS